MNELYRHELWLYQNFFLPSVKLVRKVRRLPRLPTPRPAPRRLWNRSSQAGGSGEGGRALVALHARLDPFTLAQTIDEKLDRIYRLAQPSATGKAPKSVPWSTPRGLHRKWRDDPPQSKFLRG